MHSSRNAKGFTLIATLLLLVLLSGIAIGMLMMVNTEAKVGTHDLQNNATFHAAEGAIEKMTSDLSNTFQNVQSPTVSDITGLSALAPPGTGGISYPTYSLTPVTTSTGALSTSYGQIATGSYAGLYAQLLNVQLQATAQGPLGDEVNMSRTVEVAMIPVFQFGVFSTNDLAFFSSPPITFAGRVHTNGDLYIGCGGGNTCIFTDKISAYGNVVRQNLPNGLDAPSNNDNGTVKAPKASGGCSGTMPNCVTFSNTTNLWGSVVGMGGNPPQSAYNGSPYPAPSWQTISLTNFGGMVIDGDYGNSKYGTGASNLTLPFVSGTTGTTTGPQPFEIVRRPPASESTTSPLGASRLYNEAQIRVLLSDSPADLPGGVNDPDNVRLANFKNTNTSLDYTYGVPLTGTTSTLYFATASTAVPNQSVNGATGGTLQSDWLYEPSPAPSGYVTLYDANAPQMWTDASKVGLSVAPPNITVSCNTSVSPPTCPNGGAYPYYSPLPTLSLASSSAWNLLDGYLRVEYLNSTTGNYVGVTREWLGLGFGRGLVPPSSPGTNPVAANAILLFQQPAKRNTATGTLDATGTAPNCVKSGSTYTCTNGKPPEVAYDQIASDWAHGSAGASSQSITQFNWYPINFYDAREGEPVDSIAGNMSCTPLGVMNAVELDVGNLQQWLAGKTGTSGSKVDYTSQNGYILYFSDRRGMLPNPNGTQVDAAGTKTGDAGFEDVVNRTVANRLPNGTLDPTPTGAIVSPEDNNENGKLDYFGSINLGLGLGYVPTASTTPGAAYAASKQVNALVNATAAPDPYLVGNRMSTCAVAQDGWVSGARHVLKLVDGSLGYLPVRPDNNGGGFTVGSENPVYIQGNYNTNSSDTIWSTGVDKAHSAAGIVADSVTLLSNNWSDWNSILKQPSQPSGNRTATTTYYRVAVAAGKVQAFPFPSAWASSTDYYMGTDGGVHNFLRFLEDWQSTSQSLYYYGSLVNLFFSTYNTGIMKCCTYSVYQPPTRHYTFDTDFSQPQNLPPGTPLFRDIDNLSYRQTFTACTVNANGVCSN